MNLIMDLKHGYTPKGFRFFCARNRKEMILVDGGSFDGWLCFKGPDGNWVTLRKATAGDLAAIAAIALNLNPQEIAKPESLN